MLNNIQYMLISLTLLMSMYELGQAINTWFYSFFLEKINRQKSFFLDINKIKKHLLSTTIWGCSAIVLMGLPLLQAITTVLVVGVCFQLLKINKLVLNVRAFYAKHSN